MKGGTVIALIFALAWNHGGYADSFVFSGPPLETADRGQSVYGPIADFLTESTGERFVHHSASSWLSYAKEMRNGSYDLLFDAPHVVAWRVEVLNHVPLIKLPGTLDFVVISRINDEEIIKLDDLAGHKVCTGAPHDLGTLLMQTQFTNPVRQPQIQAHDGAELIFDGLTGGRCRGAVMPTSAYRAIRNGRWKSQVRILHLSDPVPNWAFTAGPRISGPLQEAIRSGLLSPGGVVATQALRELLADGGQWQATGGEEYREFAELLTGLYGFSR